MCSDAHGWPRRSCPAAVTAMRERARGRLAGARGRALAQCAWYSTAAGPSRALPPPDSTNSRCSVARLRPNHLAMASASRLVHAAAGARRSRRHTRVWTAGGRSNRAATGSPLSALHRVAAGLPGSHQDGPPDGLPCARLGPDECHGATSASPLNLRSDCQPQPASRAPCCDSNTDTSASSKSPCPDMLPSHLLNAVSNGDLPLSEPSPA